MFIKDNGKINKRFIKHDPVSGDNVEVHELNYSGALLFSEYKDKFEEFLRLTEKYKINSANLRLYTNNLIKNTEDSIETEEYNTYFPMYSSDSGIINVKGQTYDISNYIDSSENIIFSYIQSKECPFSKGEKYFINNIEFKCIGDYIETFIPYNSVPDDFVVGVFSVKYDAVLNQNDINDIISISQSILPIDIEKCLIPDPVDPDNIQLSFMLFVISALIMVIVVLAIAKFYSFILSERKNNLVIMRICGCTRGKVHIIYMLEILITMLFSLAAGYLIFRYLLFGVIVWMYPSFEEFYTEPVYCYVIAAYFTVSMLITAFAVIPSTKASITETRRKK